MKIRVIGRGMRNERPDASARILRENETVRIPAVVMGSRVTCLSGQIWLTEGTGGRDHILRENEAWVAEKPGLIVLWAVRASAFAVFVPRSDSCRRFFPFGKGSGRPR